MQQATGQQLRKFLPSLPATLVQYRELDYPGGLLSDSTPEKYMDSGPCLHQSSIKCVCGEGSGYGGRLNRHLERVPGFLGSEQDTEQHLKLTRLSKRAVWSERISKWAAT